MSYDSHTNNVMAVGFQRDENCMYSGSEDGTVKFGTWVMRSFYNMAPGFQREYESRAAVNTVVLHPNQVPEVDTAVGSLTVMWDGSLIVAANNRGTCYVWRLLLGTQTMSIFEPLHKLLAHDGYILKCLLSPEFCQPNRWFCGVGKNSNSFF
ncbi:target of rapamycin complex subunit LST8-like isoform X2 [Primulina eburnea]|uniref:target of rapamycin complex subunit LST8-like isoform X2 n=1 Tax=Primulina eburnea TaxID=1245227 RepID=UPI003C6C6DDD